MMIEYSFGPLLPELPKLKNVAFVHPDRMPIFDNIKLVDRVKVGITSGIEVYSDRHVPRDRLYLIDDQGQCQTFRLPADDGL